MQALQWEAFAANLIVALVGLGIIAIITLIIYKLIKRLIKFGIEYYFYLKRTNGEK